MSVITNDNVIKIMKSLEEVANVSQVRTHYTLKPLLVEKYGENSVVFSTFFLPLNQVGMNSYSKLWTVVTEELYDNVERNMAIIYNMQTRIEEYYANTQVNSNLINSGVAAVLDGSNVIFIPIEQ